MKRLTLQTVSIVLMALLVGAVGNSCTDRIFDNPLENRCLIFGPDGNCTNCDLPFTGPACSQCKNPRYGGPDCEVCLPKFTGVYCQECVGAWTGAFCDVCPSNYVLSDGSCDQCAGNYTGTTCSQCKPGHAGANCNECSKTNFAAPDCVSCTPKFTGPNCAQCADPHFVGAQCNECANPGFEPPNCILCPPKFKGENCNECLDSNFAAPDCDTCLPQFKGLNCDECSQPNFDLPACDTCIIGWSGANCSQSASCKSILAMQPGAKSGIYTLTPKPDGPSMDAYCDMTTDSGGWTLMLAYDHLANSNEPLIGGTLPTDPNAGYAHIYLEELGVSVFSVTEIRFYCTSSEHNRVLHFKTSMAAILDVAFKGSGLVSPAIWKAGSMLPGHTASLPQSTTCTGTCAGGPSVGFHAADTFYDNKNGHRWSIRAYGNEWACDDDVPSHDTHHQVWFR